MIRNFGSSGILAQPTGLDIGLGAGGFIKSIQRGTVTPFNDTTTTSLNIAISSIDPTKSIIRLKYLSSGSAGSSGVVRAVINSATQINLARNGSAQALGSVIEWEVIEFTNVKSKQTGGTSGTSNSITIASVNTLKSLIFYSVLSMNTNAIGTMAMDQTALINFTSSTTLNLTANSQSTIYWQVIEFN